MVSVEIQQQTIEDTEESDAESVNDNTDEDLFKYLFESFLERRNTADLTLFLPKDLLQMRLDYKNYDLVLSSTTAKLQLIHKDSNVT